MIDGDGIDTIEDDSEVAGCLGGTSVECDAAVVGVDVSALLAITPELARH
jgi:hypothetical protein